jgi:hypothetical protein
MNKRRKQPVEAYQIDNSECGTGPNVLYDDIGPGRLRRRYHSPRSPKLRFWRPEILTWKHWSPSPSFGTNVIPAIHESDSSSSSARQPTCGILGKSNEISSQSAIASIARDCDKPLDWVQKGEDDLLRGGPCHQAVNSVHVVTVEMGQEKQVERAARSDVIYLPDKRIGLVRPTVINPAEAYVVTLQHATRHAPLTDSMLRHSHFHD